VRKKGIELYFNGRDVFQAVVCVKKLLTKKNNKGILEV
jgi:hypothetical protein